jgi:hypothetical protein
MYYWYEIAFFDETPEDKYEAETISVDYIIFSDLKVDPLCEVLNHNEPGPFWAQCHGKGLILASYFCTV